jgi:hypothetical protein
MLFKDLKPGERFVFDTYENDNEILTYTKLQKAVHCQISIIQMSKRLCKKEEMKLLLNMLCDNESLKAYTATSADGELVWISDDAKVFKLCE